MSKEERMMYQIYKFVRQRIQTFNYTEPYDEFFVVFDRNTYLIIAKGYVEWERCDKIFGNTEAYLGVPVFYGGGHWFTGYNTLRPPYNTPYKKLRGGFLIETPEYMEIGVNEETHKKTGT